MKQSSHFRIGEIYLTGKKLRILGIPVANSLERAVTISRQSSGQHRTESTQRARNLILASAREKQGANDAAIEAYQAVVDKFSERTDRGRCAVPDRLHLVPRRANGHKRHGGRWQRQNCVPGFPFSPTQTAKKQRRRAIISTSLSKNKRPVPSK